MASIIRKLRHFINSDYALSNTIKKQLYNIIHIGKSRIIKIKELTECKSNIIKTYIASEQFISYFPLTFGNNVQKTNVIRTPEINLYKFREAIVNANSSAIFSKNKIIVFRMEGERFNEGFIKVHDQKNSKIIFNNNGNLNNGYFLGGNGSWNWYHFLIEIAPKILLLEKEYSDTILVNSIVKKIPSMEKVLTVLTKEMFKIEYLEPEHTYKVNTLLYINNFNNIQFNRFDNKTSIEGCFFNKNLLQKYSNKIMDSLQSEKESNTPSKIFLYRKNTHRIAKNQDEILQLLIHFGFVAISLEEMDIKEQINHFKNAKFIIGTSGAAWSNLIFCRNNPKSICFMPDNAEEFVAFSNLAKMFNVDFYQLFYKGEDHHYASNFIIDTVQLSHLINTLNERH
ncbi:glycosyltransferase family 61 protein [Empedobacter falsenii]